MKISGPWAPTPLWWLAAIEDTLSALKGDRERNAVSPYVCAKVALVLAWRANKTTTEAWPAQEKLAERAGVSVAQARRALAVLEAAGIICRRRRQRASTLYSVIFECANVDHSEHATDGAAGILDSTGSDQSSRPLIAQTASLSDRNGAFDRALGARQTDHTEQIILENKISVRGAMRRIEGTPSDALVEAILPFTGDGSYKTAYREGQKALKALGPRMEAALIVALGDPKTACANRPIGFAIRAVQLYGGVL